MSIKNYFLFLLFFISTVPIYSMDSMEINSNRKRKRVSSNNIPSKNQKVPEIIPNFFENHGIVPTNIEKLNFLISMLKTFEHYQSTLEFNQPLVKNLYLESIANVILFVDPWLCYIETQELKQIENQLQNFDIFSEQTCSDILNHIKT